MLYTCCVHHCSVFILNKISKVSYQHGAKTKQMWTEKKSGEKIKALKPSFLTVLLLLCLWFFDQIKETSFHGIWPNSSLKVSKKLNQERPLLYLKRKMEKGTYCWKYHFTKDWKVGNTLFNGGCLCKIQISPTPISFKRRNLSNTKFPKRFFWYGNQIPIAILLIIIW